MQSIFGKINFKKQPVQEEDVNTALADLSLGKTLKQFITCNKNFGFGAVQFFQTRCKKKLIVTDETKTFVLIGDCRIDNRNELIKKLKIKNHHISDDELILICFDQWNTDCPKYLTGDFSFAIWNNKPEELFCARDHFGVKPFNYYLDKNQFIFSSEIHGILSQTDVKLTIDKQFIADTISIIKSEHRRSTYNEIKKLPPAHSLHLKNGKITITKYWTLKPAKVSFKNDDEYLNQFKDLLFNAIKKRLKDPLKYGSELSGGIDSSSLTSIASKFFPVSTFSHVLPEKLIGKIHPFKDEKNYINLLTNFCTVKEKNFITSEKTGILDALKNSLLLNKCIVQQNFSVFSDHLYRAAGKQNIQILLSGFGGDEVVTSKSSNYLSEISHNKQFKTDLKNQNYSSFKIFTLQLKKQLKNYFPKSTDLIIRIIKGKKWWIEKYKNLAVNKTFNDEMNIKSGYFDYYKNIKKENLIEQSIERITHQHVSQRLEYSSLAAKQYGIEYRYPLLDKDLVEFYLSMPPRLKARNGILRYTIRKAMDGYLPKEIQWRNDKSGATIPTVYMRALQDKDKIERIIKRARSNPRINQYIDMEKYEQWYEKFFQRSKNYKFNNPGAFFNYLKLILFIEDNPSLFE